MTYNCTIKVDARNWKEFDMLAYEITDAYLVRS